MKVLRWRALAQIHGEGAGKAGLRSKSSHLPEPSPSPGMCFTFILGQGFPRVPDPSLILGVGLEDLKDPLKVPLPFLAKNQP